MSNNSIKLLGSLTSPFVFRVRVALNLKNLPYEFFEESVINKSERLLYSNPIHKKIPVLVHDGKPLCESLIILHYIDATWTSGLAILPSDPFTCYEHRFWGDYVDNKILHLLREIIAAKEGEEQKAAIERMREALKPLEEAYQKMSGGERFFGGESIGYLDIALGSFLGWLCKALPLICGVEILNNGEMPGLWKWAEAFSSHPAVHSVFPPTDNLLNTAKIIKTRGISSATKK